MKAAAVIFLGDVTFMKPDNDSVVSGRFFYLPLISPASTCLCVCAWIVTPTPFPQASSLHLHLWASCLCHSATPLQSSPLFLFVPSQRSRLTIWLPVFPTQISSHNISTLCIPSLLFPPSNHTPNPTLLYCLPAPSHSLSSILKTLCGVCVRVLRKVVQSLLSSTVTEVAAVVLLTFWCGSHFVHQGVRCSKLPHNPPAPFHLFFFCLLSVCSQDICIFLLNADQLLNVNW